MYLMMHGALQKGKIGLIKSWEEKVTEFFLKKPAFEKKNQ